MSDVLHSAFEAIESCTCADGCAKCTWTSFDRQANTDFSLGIISSYCKENNDVASKLGAQVLLRGILGLPIDLDAIPEQDIDNYTITVVEAQTVRAVQGVEVELYVDGP